MDREITRTLFTLSPSYQNRPKQDYEVVIVDNGSKHKLSEKYLDQYGFNYQYIYVDNADPSPAKAMNNGIDASEGSIIGLMVDGARMLSPGILKYVDQAFKTYDTAVVSTLGYHLGFERQQLSSHKGYDQEKEDELLDSIDWKEGGYELFRIAAFAGSSRAGWFAPLAESNCFFINKSKLEELGKVDERFALPGGGLVNLDIYKRCVEAEDVTNVRILGEGTFHQFHGGSSTNNVGQTTWDDLNHDYHQIKGYDFEIPKVEFETLGKVHSHLKYSLRESGKAFMYLNQDEIKEELTGRCIFILGMHRSGTSMLAGTLQEAGLFLGKVINKSPFNKKGNKESKDLWFINNHVLEINQGAWDNPPKLPIWDGTSRLARDHYLRQFIGSEVWGFKDPRCVLTLDGWIEVIPNFQFAGIFRHPFLVAESLMKRNKMPYKDSLQVWLEYNWRLKFYKKKYDFPLIEFNVDSTKLKRDLSLMIEELDLPHKNIDFSFLEEKLRNAEIPNIQTENSAQALQLYGKLQRMGSYQKTS